MYCTWRIYLYCNMGSSCTVPRDLPVLYLEISVQYLEIQYGWDVIVVDDDGVGPVHAHHKVDQGLAEH